jgi:proteic killer suppression protein
VIRSFATQGTRDLFDGRDTKDARRTCPITLWGNAKRKLDQLNQAAELRDLRAPPGNRLERLKGDRRGQHSIRINDRYRVCFRWTVEGPEDVEIVDYHR